MEANYSLHTIDTANFFSFNATEYSRFKFGDGGIAEQYGNALATAFIKDILENTTLQSQIVVISSPYAFIPTATLSMSHYFVYTLNRWLADNNLPIVQTTKIHRTITYKEDYGELDAEQRQQLIGNDTFHIDKFFLNKKILIFLDDIKITGSHERMIQKMIREHELENDVYFLYFAELKNTNIHPNIENYLNYAFVKSIFDLNSIINTKRFIINTRIVKYILNAKTDAFYRFIQSQDDSFLNNLFDMALGNNYHTIDAYDENMTVLKQYLQIKL